MATITKITLAQFAQRACAVYAYAKTSGYKGHNNTVYSYGQLGLPMSSTGIVPKAPFPNIMTAPRANEKSRDYQVRYKPLSEYKFGGYTKLNLGTNEVPDGVFGFDCTGFLQYLIYGPFQTVGGWEEFNPPDTYDYLNGYNLAQALKEGEDRLCIDPTRYEESQCMSKQIGYTNSDNLVSWDDREQFNEWSHREGYVALHWYNGNVDHCGIVVNASTLKQYLPSSKYNTGTLLLDCCYNWLEQIRPNNNYFWGDGVCVKLLGNYPRSAIMGNRNCCVLDSYGFTYYDSSNLTYFDLISKYNREGPRCINCYGSWYDPIGGVALLYSDSAHTQPLTGDATHIYYAQDLSYNDEVGCILTYSAVLSKWNNPRNKNERYDPHDHQTSPYPWAYFGNWSRHILDAAVKQLQTPVIVSFNSATKVLTWTPNGDETHCEGYRVTIKHGSSEISPPVIGTATTSSATISDYTLGDSLSIKAVVTDAYKSTWKDSEEVSVTIAPLAVPQGLRYQWTNDTMYWNSVPSARTYRVRINGTDTGRELTSPSLEGLSSYTTGEMTGKVITVEAHCGLIRAHSTSSAYTIQPAPSVDTEINSTEIPIITLYSSEEDTFDTMGICSLSDAASINVVNERNGDYYLEMLYPLGTEKSSLIQNHCIITVKPNPYDDYEPFRIYSIEKNSEREIKIKAYHISYDLNGWIMRPNAERSDATIKLSYDDLLARLNNSVEGAIVQPTSHNGAASKYKFNFVSTFEQSARETSPLNGSFTLSVPDNVRSIIVGSEKSMLSGFKGEFKFVRWTVYHQPETQEADATAKCSIRYRKNIKAITAKYSADCAYSAIFPYGVKSSGNSQQSSTVVWMAKDPPVVPIQEGATLTSLDFSKVLCLDVSDELIPGISTNDTIGTINNPTDVMFERVCRKYISENNLNNLQGGLATEIEIDLANLNLRNTEFAEYANLERLRLSEWVKVVYPGIDLAVTMRVEKVEYDALTDRYTSVTLKMVSDNSTPTSVLSSPSQTKALSGTDVINIVKAMGLENEVVTAYYVNNSFYRVYDETTPSEPITGKSDAIYVDKLTNYAYYFFGDQGFIPIAYAAAESKLVMGYYYNGTFYSDSAHTTAITPSATKIYLDYHTNTVYRYDTTLTPSIYVQIGTGIVFGYYHNSQFYKELAHTTLITPTANTVYIDITSGANRIYRYDTTLVTPAYIQIGGGGSVYGYYKPSDKKFYQNYNGTTYSGEIAGAANTEYIDKTTPSHGIFMYESETGFTAITYNEVAKSPYYDSSETAHKAGTKGILPAAPANQYGYILSTSLKDDEGAAPTNQNNVLWASPSSLGLLEHKPYYSAEANYSGMMKYWKITLDPETEEPSYSWQYITAPSAAEVAQGELYLSWNSGTPKWKTATGGSIPTPTAENKVLMSNAQLSWVETDPSALPGLLPLTAGSAKPITGPLYLCQEPPTTRTKEKVLLHFCQTSAPTENSPFDLFFKAKYVSDSTRQYIVDIGPSNSAYSSILGLIEVNANGGRNIYIGCGSSNITNSDISRIDLGSISGGYLSAWSLTGDWIFYSKYVTFGGLPRSSTTIQELRPFQNGMAQLGSNNKRFNQLLLSEYVDIGRDLEYGVPDVYTTAFKSKIRYDYVEYNAFTLQTKLTSVGDEPFPSFKIICGDNDVLECSDTGMISTYRGVVSRQIPPLNTVTSVFKWQNARDANTYNFALQVYQPTGKTGSVLKPQYYISADGHIGVSFGYNATLSQIKIGDDSYWKDLLLETTADGSIHFSTYSISLTATDAIYLYAPTVNFWVPSSTDFVLRCTGSKSCSIGDSTYKWTNGYFENVYANNLPPAPDGLDQIIVSQETSEGSEEYRWTTAVKSALGFLPLTAGINSALTGTLASRYLRSNNTEIIGARWMATTMVDGYGTVHPDSTLTLSSYVNGGYSSFAIGKLSTWSFDNVHLIEFENVTNQTKANVYIGYSKGLDNSIDYFKVSAYYGIEFSTSASTSTSSDKYIKFKTREITLDPAGATGNTLIVKPSTSFVDLGDSTHYFRNLYASNVYTTKLPDPVYASGESGNKTLTVNKDSQTGILSYSWISGTGSLPVPTGKGNFLWVNENDTEPHWDVTDFSTLLDAEHNVLVWSERSAGSGYEWLPTDLSTLYLPSQGIAQLARGYIKIVNLYDSDGDWLVLNDNGTNFFSIRGEYEASNLNAHVQFLAKTDYGLGPFFEYDGYERYVSFGLTFDGAETRLTSPITYVGYHNIRAGTARRDSYLLPYNDSAFPRSNYLGDPTHKWTQIYCQILSVDKISYPGSFTIENTNSQYNDVVAVFHRTYNTSTSGFVSFSGAFLGTDIVYGGIGLKGIVQSSSILRTLPCARFLLNGVMHEEYLLYGISAGNGISVAPTYQGESRIGMYTVELNLYPGGCLGFDDSTYGLQVDIGALRQTLFPSFTSADAEKVLAVNQSGTNFYWKTISEGGGGTVTSIAVKVGAWESPAITTSGVIDLSNNVQPIINASNKLSSAYVSYGTTTVLDAITGLSETIGGKAPVNHTHVWSNINDFESGVQTIGSRYFQAKGSCFVEGTKIKMFDGTEKNIEDIECGDSILTYDVETGKNIEGVVALSVDVGLSGDFDAYVFEDGSYVEVHNKHSFWNENKQMIVPITEWSLGDQARKSSGECVRYVSVDRVRHLIQKRYYTLITNNNLYYVNGILVGHWSDAKYNTLKRDAPDFPSQLFKQYSDEVDLNRDRYNFAITPEILAKSSSLLADLRSLTKRSEALKKSLSNSDYNVTKAVETFLTKMKTMRMWTISGLKDAFESIGDFDYTTRAAERNEIMSLEPQISALQSQYDVLRENHEHNLMSKSDYFKLISSAGNKNLQQIKYWATHRHLYKV